LYSGFSNRLIYLFIPATNVLQLKLGIQLESLQLPFRQALRAAAEMGVQAVEINGRSELRPDELTRTGVRHVRKLLADLNLTVCSIHFPRAAMAMWMIWKRELTDETSHVRGLRTGRASSTNRAIPDDVAAPEWPVLLQALTDLGRHGQRVGSCLAARTGPMAAIGSRI
jgi:sugar phosphate isomerase/epimerase